MQSAFSSHLTVAAFESGAMVTVSRKRRGHVVQLRDALRLLEDLLNAEDLNDPGCDGAIKLDTLLHDLLQ